MYIEQLVYDDDSGEEREVKLPAKYEVCGRCDGRGVHDHPAFSNGFTSDEMYEMGGDFREDYVGGVYDVPCTTCGGKRVVAVPDEDRCAPEDLELYHNHMVEMFNLRAEEEAERRMGA